MPIFTSSVILVDVKLRDVSTGRVFPEEVIQEINTVKIEAGKEFEIAVTALGSCFSGPFRDNIWINVRVGGISSGILYELRLGETQVIKGWSLSRGVVHFKTLVPDYDYQSVRTQPRNSNLLKMNTVEVQIFDCKLLRGAYREYNLPQNLETPGKLVKSHEDKKFFKDPSLQFQSGNWAGYGTHGSDLYVTDKREIAFLSAIIEQPHIVTLRAEDAKRLATKRLRETRLRSLDPNDILDVTSDEVQVIFYSEL